MSEEQKKRTMAPPTLCWDCRKATGGCNWSDHFKAVKGWKIIPTQKIIYGGAGYKSCVVLECPEFERDGAGYGLKRYKDGVAYVPVSKDT